MEETRCWFGPPDHIRLKGVRQTGATGISPGFVEAAVGQVVSKRRSMRRTRRGAHLMLRAKTRVLDGEPEDAIRRRWPGVRPPPNAAVAERGGSSAWTPARPRCPVLGYTPASPT